MQMLQWWTEGPTTEALFCRGGGRLVLCVCATHRHTTVITLTIQPGWWRRWGVEERVSATDEDGNVKPSRGMLMPVIHGPFGPVLPVNVSYSGRLIMFLGPKVCSMRCCSFILALVALVCIIGTAGKLLLILPSVRLFLLSGKMSQLY